MSLAQVLRSVFLNCLGRELFGWRGHIFWGGVPLSIGVGGCRFSLPFWKWVEFRELLVYFLWNWHFVVPFIASFQRCPVPQKLLNKPRISSMKMAVLHPTPPIVSESLSKQTHEVFRGTTKQQSYPSAMDKAGMSH